MSSKTESVSISSNAANKALASSASTFIWIAALSLLNMIVALFGGQWQMVIGLGITQVLAALIHDGSTALKIIAGLIAAGFLGLFYLCGRKTLSGRKWPIVTGGLIYLIDIFLLILFADYLGIVFHIWMLFLIFRPLFLQPKSEQIQAKLNTKGKVVFGAAKDKNGLPIAFFALFIMIVVLYHGHENAVALMISLGLFCVVIGYSVYTRVKVQLLSDHMVIKYFRRSYEIHYSQIRSIKKAGWSAEIELKQPMGDINRFTLFFLSDKFVKDFIDSYETISNLN